MPMEMKRWRITVETSLFNCHDVEMSALTASIALRKIAYDYPTSNASWFSEPEEIVDEPEVEEPTENMYSFNMPAITRFTAYVYATSEEKARKMIENGEYEDGETEGLIPDYTKATLEYTQER